MQRWHFSRFWLQAAANPKGNHFNRLYCGYKDTTQSYDGKYLYSREVIALISVMLLSFHYFSCHAKIIFHLDPDGLYFYHPLFH